MRSISRNKSHPLVQLGNLLTRQFFVFAAERSGLRDAFLRGEMTGNKKTGSLGGMRGGSVDEWRAGDIQNGKPLILGKYAGDPTTREVLHAVQFVIRRL